jgi:NADH-quinone oxidoreductase subunit J
MIGEALLFYLFAGTLLGSASCVILARNPVHSVLFLILCFLNGTGLFVLLNAEFLAMLLAIVYVGAVAVLFLFVVMMLDINFQDLRQETSKHAPLLAVIGIILAIELSVTAFLCASSNQLPQSVVSQPQKLSNVHLIGQVLYTDYFVIFQTAGLILLVAMIGAIVLTLRFRPETRRQNPTDQLRRSPANTLTLHQGESGKGVSLS